MYEVAKRVVYSLVVKEFFYCAYLVFGKEITNRCDNNIISITLEDTADALEVSLSNGERHSNNWLILCEDTYIIWKDPRK